MKKKQLINMDLANEIVNEIIAVWAKYELRMDDKKLIMQYLNAVVNQELKKVQMRDAVGSVDIGNITKRAMKSVLKRDKEEDQ